MTFLHPSFLWALPLALGPLAIHLFYRKNPKRLPFSDLRFVRAAMERMENRLRLRQYLLLLVRMLILALLVVFFARPLWQGGGRPGTEGETQPAVVLLVDVSSSMGYREEGSSRLDRFKADAHAIVDRMPPASRIGIVAFSDRVETATPVLGNDPAFLHRMIDGLALTARPTDPRAAWETAQKLFEQTPEQARNVVLLSDGASHAFHGKLEASAGRTRLIAFPPSGGENQCLADLSAAFDGTDQAWHITAGGKTAGAACPISFFAEDRKTLSDFARGGKDGFTHEFVWPDRAERLNGRVELGPDRLVCDNVRYVAAGRPKTGRVEIVDGDPKFGGATAESFYLKTALPDAEVFTEDGQERMPLEVPGVVMLANVRTFSPRLAGFVRSGGGLLVFAGSRSSDETWPEYLPASLGTIFEKPQNVAWKAERHALAAEVPAAGFEWGSISAERGFVLQCREGAEVLGSLANGWPFIVEGEYGDGRIVLCASTADREWCNLAGKPVFAPLMQGFVRYLSRSKDGQENLNILVGEPFRCAAVADPAVVAPSGKRMRPKAAGDSIIMNDTEEPGLYRVFSGNREVLTFAVNVDLRSGERDLSPAGRGTLRGYFGENPVVMLPADGWENEFSAIISGKDVSRHALALVFLLLIGEVLLSRPLKRAGGGR